MTKITFLWPDVADAPSFAMCLLPVITVLILDGLWIKVELQGLSARQRLQWLVYNFKTISNMLGIMPYYSISANELHMSYRE